MDKRFILIAAVALTCFSSLIQAEQIEEATFECQCAKEDITYSLFHDCSMGAIGCEAFFDLYSPHRLQAQTSFNKLRRPRHYGNSL